jgi:hypothetical protein
MEMACMNAHDLSSDTIRLECLKMAQELALRRPYVSTTEQILEEAKCYAKFVRMVECSSDDQSKKEVKDSSGN